MHTAKTKHPVRRARPVRRAPEGFTILETVIALSVAMVVGFGAVSLFLFSANFNSGAADRARALAIAQQRIENLRALAYDNAALNISDTTQQVDVGSTNPGESDRRTFSVRTKIEYDTAVSNNRQKIITITVTPAAAGRWSGGGVVLRMLRSSDVVGS